MANDMRLIGNKSRLLGDIEALLSERGVRGGTFIDIFCGTACVGRHFKSLGFRVIANDHLSMCYSKAVAEVEVNRSPGFLALRDKYREFFLSRDPAGEIGLEQGMLSFEDPEKLSRGRGARSAPPLAKVIHLLNHHVEPREGLVYRNYCPGSGSGRRYFTDENGKRIDGILAFLRENHRSGLLSSHELHLLLSSLLDAADRVANISGTYGAFLKTWQSNARSRVELKVPSVTETSLRHQAFQEDANRLVRRLKGDVLYIDPPYNKRQYPANYHILEVIAEFHQIEDLSTYEEALYGKTGLRPYRHLKSLYCVPPSARSKRENVLSAMTDLILSSRVEHVVVSYNEEGLLTREEIGSILSRFQGTRSFDFERNMRSILYRRFRSDSDRSTGHTKGKREYKVLDGKKRNEISEWLFVASRGRRFSRRPSREMSLPASELERIP